MFKEPPFPILSKKIEKPFIPLEKQRNRFGRMVYGHKTAGVIDIMTREQFEDRKSYEPGKFGRSSIKTKSKTNGGASGGLGGI